MSISSISSIYTTPPQKTNPTNNGDGVENKQPDEENTNDKVSISPEAFKKLKESNNPESDKKSELPEHIQQMIKAIERIVEQIKVAEQTLIEAESADYESEEAKQATLDSHQSHLNSLEVSRFDAIKALQEAMKEAGIQDMSIIADLMS